MISPESNRTSTVPFQNVPFNFSEVEETCASTIRGTRVPKITIIRDKTNSLKGFANNVFVISSSQSIRLRRRRNDLFGRVSHAVGGNDVDARVAQHLAPFFDVRSLQPRHDGNLHAEVF